MGYFQIGAQGTPTPPQPTFPASVLAKMAFRGDYKRGEFQEFGFKTKAFYIDPAYPNILLERGEGGKPVLTADGWLFDRNAQSFLSISDISNVVEMWAVARSLDNGTFADLSMIMSVAGDYYAYGSSGDNNIDFSTNGIANINNVNNYNFAPLDTFKTVAFEIPTGFSNGNIGAYQSNQYFWNGYVKDVLCFSTALTSTERTALQAYLAGYHNF